MYTYFAWYDGSMLPIFFRSGLQEGCVNDGKG